MWTLMIEDDRRFASGDKYINNKLCMKSQREQVSFITLTGIQKMNVAYSSLKSIRNMSVKL